MKPNSNILIYQTEDGQIKIQTRLEGDIKKQAKQNDIIPAKDIQESQQMKKQLKEKTNDYTI